MSYSISRELENQDNRATSEPMFIVQYSDDGGAKWEYENIFFTLKGAEIYIENNNYEHAKYRVYIASGHKNLEWQQARKMLMDDKF